uniref:Uncharacterized protein n=1 Tax=Siphoviridae sp. cttDR14 TaxID=2826490 RepID=A0A8S5M1V4_9CAUD|nr:MAG TPA: hypothetical protein [Siphoviridae sp. cttDR14]
MITKEELAKLSRDEVSALFYEKRNACRTCAQFGEMIFNDKEYIMIKERLSEFYIEDRRKNEQRKKAQVVKEFAERVKNAFYAEFDEIIPSIMANKIDDLVKEYEK